MQIHHFNFAQLRQLLGFVLLTVVHLLSEFGHQKTLSLTFQLWSILVFTKICSDIISIHGKVHDCPGTQDGLVHHDRNEQYGD